MFEKLDKGCYTYDAKCEAEHVVSRYKGQNFADINPVVFEKATPPRAGGVAFFPGSGKRRNAERKEKQETQLNSIQFRF